MNCKKLLIYADHLSIPLVVKSMQLLRKTDIFTNKNFEVLPLPKYEKDYTTYMPHDKHSILLRKSVKLRVRNDPYDMPGYDSTLKDKNLNNSRHLMHGCQHMSTLKWETGLRDYP
jgi:hypothetical protein